MGRSVLRPERGRVDAAILVATLVTACGSAGAGLARLAPDGGSGSSQGAAASDSGLPNSADYADVNIPMDFTQPVWLPPPDPVIQGDASELIGSWVEVTSDGTPCTPATATINIGGTVCTHLEIRQAADGGFLGTVYRELLPGTPGSPITGPFAAAADPNVGYPTTVSPKDYNQLQGFTAGVRYRVLGGALMGTTFAFWISPFDLWTDWCALQTPSLWTVNGNPRYRCASQTADAATTDLGKLVLCTSAGDRPMCVSYDGSTLFPCVCLNDAGDFTGGPLCGRAACDCSASECRANLRNAVLDGSFELQGGKLVGYLDVVAFPGSGYTTLEKVAP
jgi:hypothetical protein